MPCYHPLYGIRDPEQLTPNGKPLIHIVGSHKPNILEEDAIVQIPCGQCIGCQINYSRQWANRLMLELKDHDPEKCWFVTLTFNDENLWQQCMRFDPETDEPYEMFSLDKRHIQLFMKKLRNRFNLETRCDPDTGEVILYKRGPKKGTPKLFRNGSPAVRFYAAGEYGSENFRPHYHLILYNVPLQDYGLTFLKKSQLGFNYFSSDLLANDLWPYGFNVVAPVTWQSCAYTARYVTKKIVGKDSHVYYDNGIIPPFALCSRKPGIARNYYEHMQRFSETPYIVIGTSDGSRKFAPPSYFERLFEKDFPEEAQHRKAMKQALAIERRKAQLSKTDLSEEVYLQNEEDMLTKRLSPLYNYRNL